MSHEVNNGEDSHEDRHIVSPSWLDITEALRRLDGRMHPALFLSLHARPRSYPMLSIIGGPDEYTVSLALGNERGESTNEKTQYVNPTRFSRFERGGYRAIGNGYSNYEIEEGFLTSNFALIQAIVEHFAEHGVWYPKAPYIVQKSGNFGDVDEYTE
jgi:hypothetical protein